MKISFSSTEKLYDVEKLCRGAVVIVTAHLYSDAARKSKHFSLRVGDF